MNRSAGGFLAVLIIVSFLASNSSQRTSVYPQAAPRGAAGTTKVHNAGPNQNTSSPPTVPPDPRCFLIRAIADFYGSGTGIQPKDYNDAYQEVSKGCNPEPTGGNTTWGVPKDTDKSVASAPVKPPIRFMIATVPDPVRSHLSLFFDRSVDAIQQGAQSAGYLFARATMPWDPEEHEAPTELAMKLEWDHYQIEKERLPGLMIFRKFEPYSPKKSRETEDLFVWIVGETPTGGIHKEQFKNALTAMRDIAMVSKMAHDQSRLVMLAPTFSGSLPSLHDLLPGVEGQGIQFQDGQAMRGAIVHSGTVESWHWIQWFREIENGVGFLTFQENDSYSECHFLRWVKKMGYRLSEVADLSEDETAFGNVSSETSSAQECQINVEGGEDDDILRMRFPREISQLRAAYQSELPAAAVNSAESRPVPRTTLPLNLTDSGSDEDTVPSYAHAQYPLSQEAVMLTITTALRAHHTRFVLIRASDPIDKLFLVRFLRQGYPQGRIVTMGSDLLYRREVEDDLLHGILALTPYSLIPRADDTNARPEEVPHTDRIFPSSDSAGIYNAALSLLLPLPQGATSGPLTVPSSAYYTELGWPQMGGRTSPKGNRLLTGALWLTVLGRDAYWPLGLLDAHGPDAGSEVASSIPMVSGNAATPTFYHPPLPLGWMVLNALALLLSVGTIMLLKEGSLLSSSEMETHLAPVRGQPRLRMLALASLVVLLIDAVVSFPWGWWFQHSFSCIGWLAGWLLMSAWLIPARCFWKELKRREAALYQLLPLFASAVGAFYVAELVAWAYVDLRGAKMNPAMFRYIQVSSGVSLLPSAMLLLLGVGWWAWYSLQGLASVDLRQPRLPLALDESWKGRTYYLTEDGSKDLLEVMGIDARVDKRLWIPPVSIALLLVFVSLPRIGPLEWHPVQTLEIPWTDLAYTLAHLGFALLLITELARLGACWNEFRRLLSALDRLQLRRAFRQLKGFSWKWLWSLGGGSSIHSYRAMAREREALLHLRLLLGTDNQKDPMLDNPGSTLEELLVEARSEAAKKLDFGWTSKVMVSWAALQSGLARYCERELEILLRDWRKEKDADMFHDVDPDQKGPDPKVPEETSRREQFVALVYVNFMVSVMLRMRTIMMTVAGLYVLLLLSISFYPVEPMVFIRPLLILLFFVIIAVVGVVYAQMHKDPILSRLTDTTPGELGMDFYMKMGTFVFLPLVSLLVSQFPDVNNFLLSWLQPAMQALNH